MMPTRFILLCHARTGSTLLGSLLASHPQISGAGEYYKVLKRRVQDGLHRQLVFRLARRYPPLYLDWRAFRCGRPVFGCKFTPPYAADFERSITALHRRGWRIVHLQRRDVVTSTLSGMVASMNKRWSTSVGETPPTPSLMRLDPLAFLNAVRHRLALNDQEERSLAGLPRLKVVYEDDLADADCWPATTERVFAYLDLSPVPARSAVQKTWSRPYSEIIENYAELIEVVGNSDLADLLLHIQAPNRAPARRGQV